MRTFAVRDEEDLNRSDLAYLVCYEKEKTFYIELPDDADPWKTPLLLSSFAAKGEKTIGSYWSKVWVEQRIVPCDRQNIGQILKENNLSEYDEFQLLTLADGRCAQDNCYLAEIDEKWLKEKFKDRYRMRVEDVNPLENDNLLVFFRSGSVKKCDIRSIAGESRFFKPILSNRELFENVEVQIGGYGVCWGGQTEISDKTLYENGIEVPLVMNDFVSFVQKRLVSTSEAAEILNCSRQNINDLISRNKLHSVKTEQKNKYFLRSEVMKRLWK